MQRKKKENDKKKHEKRRKKTQSFARKAAHPPTDLATSSSEVKSGGNACLPRMMTRIETLAMHKATTKLIRAANLALCRHAKINRESVGKTQGFSRRSYTHTAYTHAC